MMRNNRHKHGRDASPNTACEPFVGRCLLIDIEVNERGRVYAVGGVLGEHVFRAGFGVPIDAGLLHDLDAFGRGADYLLGHNILAHDIPRLQLLVPDLELWGKPVIDTLYLSPLAFPANPYHRLVKDYQLVRDSVNDPVADARLAGRVFAEQWQSFCDLLAAGSENPMFYRSFLHADSGLHGTADSLAALGAPLLTGNDLDEAFAWFAAKHACTAAVNRLLERLEDRDDPLPRTMLAYVTAWLSVAGGNSVLPPWVRHRFPDIAILLYELREQGCDSPNCAYCRDHHNPVHFLEGFFGFSDFRPEPATPTGDSLQGAVVAAAARGTTLFATLPTGGGKSLCYLLPALMRYQRRNLLTIVLSPLQALMKDQVDNFSAQTGTKLAAALYGMLTMVERGEVLEGVRMGDVGILYVSPEQLRNRSFIETIRQREIGAWVFDEAHCLSKWGHDFRPDYFYAIRFIREFAAENGGRVPPVQCFTATAKKDVKREITDTIQGELGLRVTEFAGGHERKNLHYDVYPVSRYEKYPAILELLRTRFTGSGCVVIYCATKKNTENLAEFLRQSGYRAEPFHAGLDTSLKKRILEQFIGGDIPVICATNAFGMGIDKDDVRLVIHADIPGSLENYLQEAGRAGRDRRDAECILVFDEQDIEGQFRLSGMSRLTRREIAQMLRGIRAASRGGEEVVLTAGELLRRDDVDIDPDELQDGDTRVRTAVAWLERAGFLERNENSTRVFQGKVLVRDLAEAQARLKELNLSERQQQRWLAILQALMAGAGTTTGFSADELASLSPFRAAEGDGRYETETQRVLRTLHDMAEQGLLSKETTLSAYIRYKVKNNASLHLERLSALERDFLKVLMELAPDAETGEPLVVDLRQLNQRMVDLEYGYSTPHVLKLILYGLARDGKGLAGQGGSIDLRARGNNCFSLLLRRQWDALVSTVGIRQQAARVALKVILSGVDPHEKANASLLVTFTLEQIVEGFKGDLVLLAQLKKPLAAAERALTFLHEQRVIDLQHGLAVFRQSMTLRLKKEAKSRRYSALDFSPLKTHYTERNFQIHVMNEYARRALDRISGAMRLVASYFNDDKEEFIKRFFPGRKKLLARATSEQSYGRIVTDLNNPAQERIVAAPGEKNMLVLAGPGSGKTRVVIHRVAYLLRVERVAPEAILVLCYNRGAVMELRARLRELVGDEMARVTTQTFHGLAMRLTGRSLAVAARSAGEEVDFANLIAEALALLRGEGESLGFEALSAREALVGRFSHILVDEYQDIDEEQYRLVSLLAGKTMEESDQKLTIFAVGDDDQNIYRFRGANVDFIRRFQQDYQAELHYLVENYRSTAHIIAAANHLIAGNRDRMKTDHPIRVNEARRMLPAGGNHQVSDPVARGRVQLLEVADETAQALAVVEEITRLQGVEEGVDVQSCAVLARDWQELDLVRGVLTAKGIPVNLAWGRGSGFPSLGRIRENGGLLDFLRERQGEVLTGSTLYALVPPVASQDNPWQANLRRLIDAWVEETRDSEQPVAVIEDYFYETFADQRRSRSLGSGVHLSTVHSVKGLEFDHVFLLGGHWRTGDAELLEEERRLYYVGMSRARKTLQLFAVDGVANPHLQGVAGDFLVVRRLSPPGEDQVVHRYGLLGMGDLFLDFAGLKRGGHPLHRALAALQPGDGLRLVAQREHLDLADTHGVIVARLSKAARQRWLPKVERVVAVEVVALVRRSCRDIADDTFRSRCQVESWELPLARISYQPGKRSPAPHLSTIRLSRIDRL